MTLLPPPPRRPEIVQGYEYAWAHFDRRLRERHGLTVGLIEYARLCLEIAGQDLTQSPITLSRPTRSEVLVRVRIQGVNLPCVWRVDTGLLVSAYDNTMTFRPGQGETRAFVKEKARKLRRKLARYKRKPKYPDGY